MSRTDGKLLWRAEGPGGNTKVSGPNVLQTLEKDCVCTVLLLILCSCLRYLWDVLDDVGVGILSKRLTVAQILLSCRNVLVSWRKRLVLRRSLVLVVMGFWDLVSFNCLYKKKKYVMTHLLFLCCDFCFQK